MICHECQEILVTRKNPFQQWFCTAAFLSDQTCTCLPIWKSFISLKLTVYN